MIPTARQDSDSLQLPFYDYLVIKMNVSQTSRQASFIIEPVRDKNDPKGWRIECK
jgi:hypothetical protein